MIVFIVLWPYLLTTKLRCLQRKNIGHTIKNMHINKKRKCKRNIPLIQDGMRQEKCPKNNNPPTPYSELWGIFISDTPILASLYGGTVYILGQ